MLRRLYDKTLALAGKRHAIWALAAVAFAESSFFPIPPDLLLIPMILARRAKAWLLAGVCTLFSVGGGLFGYAIGYYLFDAFGGPLLDLWGNEEKLSIFERYRDEWGAWIVVAGGFTPLPYKLITIASGAGKLDIGVFILASLVARGLRFYIVAALLWQFGPPARAFIERHLGWVALGALVILIAAVLAIRFVGRATGRDRGPPLLRRPRGGAGRRPVAASNNKARAIPREAETL